MRISVFTEGIIDPKHPAKGERQLKEAGFDNVALSMRSMIRKEDPMIPLISMPAVLLKAPDMSEGPKDAPRASAEDVMRAAAAARDGGYISAKGDSSLRPSFFVTDATEETVLEDLMDLFADSPVKLLITNKSAYLRGRRVRGRFSETRDIMAFILRHGYDRVGLCLDIGEANYGGQDPGELIMSLKGVTDVMIISENDGIHDETYLPFTLRRALDWGAVFRSIRASGFDGNLVFDAGSAVRAVPVPLRGKKVMEIKRLADYFSWQADMDNMVARYPKRVLFGAGNMCRNYMNDYGEKYPPLFTVDNDPKVWGSSFEGLEVKPPEALKELDKDTAIFICITYYDEIKAQLTEMGLDNPIEFYNDEYPNRVFEGDRLKREWE